MSTIQMGITVSSTCAHARHRSDLDALLPVQSRKGPSRTLQCPQILHPSGKTIPNIECKTVRVGECFKSWQHSG